MNNLKQHFYTFSSAVLFTISACSHNAEHDESKNTQKIGATLNKKVELAESDIPQDAMQTVLKLHPDFTVKEAEKEFKHDKVYLDLEGEVGGKEIEFDMLQTEMGWKIVEVQRDLNWDQLPKIVTQTLKADSPQFEAKRIIESKQFGTTITIYEFYSVDSSGKESRKEVKLENGEAQVLADEWTH